MVFGFKVAFEFLTIEWGECTLIYITVLQSKSEQGKVDTEGWRAKCGNRFA